MLEREKKKSKTEAMFFPSRVTMQIWIENNKKLDFILQSYQSQILMLQKNLLLKKMKIILNRCYDKSIYTEDIIGDFGFISFTKEFTYLGYIVSYDLDDYADITSRIRKASQAIVALIFSGTQIMWILALKFLFI